MNKIYIFLFFVWPLFSVGQKNDYLVKHNGDTLYGNIELRNTNFYIGSSSTKLIELNAADVKLIHSDNFKGSIVVPCILYTYTEDLTELLRYQYIKKDVATIMILKELYSTPKINLYWGTDNFKTQYYFYKTPSDFLPVQLYVNYSLGGGNTANFDKIRVWGQESQTHLEIQKGYVNQLRFIMRDCTSIPEAAWELLDYRDYSLKSIIKKYNNCE